VEDRLAIVAAVHHVVGDSAAGDSGLAGHGGRIASDDPKEKRDDPFSRAFSRVEQCRRRCGELDSCKHGAPLRVGQRDRPDQAVVPTGMKFGWIGRFGGGGCREAGLLKLFVVRGPPALRLPAPSLSKGSKGR
jgi:hypothetical protein